MIRRLWTLTSIVGIAALASCKLPPDEPTFDHILITLDTSFTYLFVGESVRLIAYPVDAAGNLKDYPVTLEAGAPSVATVVNSRLTAVAPGTAVVVATSGKTVTVLQMPVYVNATTNVTVTPAQAVIPVNATRQFTAALTNRRGSPVPGATAVWTSTDSAKVSVSATGLVTARASPVAASICARASDAPQFADCGTAVVP